MNARQILNDYADACELVSETEDDIAELKKKRAIVASDKVKGSMNEHPYAPQSFTVEGLVYDEKRVERLERERALLEERKQRAESVRVQALGIINQAPTRIQRIIRYRCMERLTWKEVAEKMDNRTTEKSVQKEFERFLKNLS